MPTLQEQDEDLAGAYSLCGQAALPRAGINEHRGQDVYEAIWYLGSIGFHVGACGRCMSWKGWIVVTVNQLRVFHQVEYAYHDITMAFSLSVGRYPMVWNLEGYDSFGICDGVGCRVMSGRRDALILHVRSNQRRALSNLMCPGGGGGGKHR